MIKIISLLMCLFAVTVNGQDKVTDYENKLNSMNLEERKKEFLKLTNVPAFIMEQVHNVSLSRMIYQNLDRLNVQFNLKALHNAAKIIIAEKNNFSDVGSISKDELAWISNLERSLSTLNTEQYQTCNPSDVKAALSFWRLAFVGDWIENEIINSSADMRIVLMGGHKSTLDHDIAEAKVSKEQQNLFKLRDRIIVLKNRITNLKSQLKKSTASGASTQKLESYRREIGVASDQKSFIEKAYYNKLNRLNLFRKSRTTATVQQISALNVIKKQLLKERILMSVFNKLENSSIIDLNRKYNDLMND